MSRGRRFSLRPLWPSAPSVVSAVVLVAAPAVFGQTVQVTEVSAKPLERTAVLNGEITPFETVDLHARVSGFIEKVLVDRGSVVKEGELLIVLSAPEMQAQIAEAEAKVQVAAHRVAEADAKLAAARSTWEKLKTASATPGAISGNELVLAEQAVAAAQGEIDSARAAHVAAQASAAAAKDLREYLQIRAPFSGVITDRLVHPGALAAPNSGPLLRLQQLARLRLVVAVPEADAAGIARGRKISFHVAAYPNRSFYGTLARVSGAMDPKTRTMPVELDVSNPDRALAPGMYPEVNWPVRSGSGAVVVPAASIVTTTERVFVIRVRDGRAQWVDVRRGAREGDQVEVYGDLSPGNLILARGSDEIRNGAPLKTTRSAASQPQLGASKNQLR